MPEHQGPARRIVIEVEDLANENDVIAALIGIGHLAFEDRKRIGQDRATGVPGLEIEIRPLVVQRAREAARYVLLTFAQDVHRKMIGREVGPETIGSLAEAP